MRTCVGCRKEDESESMIRLVLGDDGQVAVDLAGRAFGRARKPAIPAGVGARSSQGQAFRRSRGLFERIVEARSGECTREPGRGADRGGDDAEGDRVQVDQLLLEWAQ